MKKIKSNHSLIIIISIIILLLLNLVIYALVTSRLSNNFDNGTKPKMVDISKYLPFEKSSNLPNLYSTYKISGNLPKLDGAAALVPIYASTIQNIYPEGCVTYEGGTFSDDNYYGENFAKDSAMQYKNTIRGFKSVVNGGCDIFFGADLSDEQIQYAKKKHVKIETIPVGLEAFVFFVNKSNPVNNLDAEQIRNIYAGKITNWKEVGGANRIINPVTRIKSSGSQTAMEKFMGDVGFGRKHLLSVLGGSIGFSFRFYLNDMINNQKVKMLSLNEIYPNSKNIKNGTYPVIAKFYAIYRKDNTNKNTQKVIKWLLSKEGQTMIEKCGYVSIH